jgi:hypothetical protein
MRDNRRGHFHFALEHPDSPRHSSRVARFFSLITFALMKIQSKPPRFVMILIFGVILFGVSGCETRPDGTYGIPDGTVIYSPGDPDAMFPSK